MNLRFNCKGNFNEFAAMWISGVDRRIRRGQTPLVHVGLVIRMRRVDLGYTTRTFATQIKLIGPSLKVSHSTVVRQEGSSYPTFSQEVMDAACKVLGVSTSELLLQSILGPSLKDDDRLRYRVAARLVGLKEDDLMQLWSVLNGLRDQREAAPIPPPRPRTVTKSRGA